MRKWSIGIIAFLLAATTVFAQSTNDLYNQAVNSGSAYRSAYLAYVQAKNQHLQYNTGATRVAAIEKTNSVLVARNSWYSAYLKFLHQSLADATNVANYPQTVVYLDLDNQINALDSNSDLGSGSNFSDINTRSKAWEKNLEQVDKVVGAAQLQIASTRLANYQNQLQGFLDDYKQAHATPSSSQATTLSLIEEKLSSSVAKRQAVDDKLASYKNSYWAVSNFSKDLVDTQQLLLEAAKLLEELSHQL